MLKDHRDLLLAFNDLRVRYLLIGGYTLGRYTEPRVTGDLDLFVDATADKFTQSFQCPCTLWRSACRIYSGRLRDCLRDLSDRLASKPDRTHFPISGLSFEEAWRNSVDEPHLKAFQFATFRSKISSATRPQQADYRILRTSPPSSQPEKQTEIKVFYALTSLMPVRRQTLFASGN
jgi:hypothetical protein